MRTEIRPFGHYPIIIAIDETDDEVMITRSSLGGPIEAALKLPQSGRVEVGVAIAGSPSEPMIQAAAKAWWALKNDPKLWGTRERAAEQHQFIVHAEHILTAAFGINPIGDDLG
jgi:hypothetical protein